MTRRTLFKCAAAGVFSQAAFARAPQSSTGTKKAVDALPGAEKNRKLKVVFVGAHVDDWIFCPGTLARYARAGHEVVCFSLTPGDSVGMANARHMPVEQLAEIRRRDAVKGTGLLGAQFKVLDQHNQKMHVDPEAYIKFNKDLAAENPDVVIGLWPLQYHPDHRAGGNLAFNSWLQSGNKFDFYFCETYLASEESSEQFAPNRWVDVESALDVSRQVIMGNTLEAGEAIWNEYQTCTKFRGAEYGCQYAEAFVRIVTVGTFKVPPNPVPGLWYSGLDSAHDQ